MASSSMEPSQSENTTTNDEQPTENPVEERTENLQSDKPEANEEALPEDLDSEEVEEFSDSEMSESGEPSKWRKLKKPNEPGRPSGAAAGTTLSVYMAFQNPARRRIQNLIPKDREGWIDWLVYVVKKHHSVDYLSEKELRKVIVRARPNLSPKKYLTEPIVDEDAPECLSWDVAQVGNWLASHGWEHLRPFFSKNFVTGRRLILIDCSALNQMGLQDLDEMKEITGEIRNLLGIPYPNQYRSISRIPPFESFLLQKVYTGKKYDELTFERFCEIEGYNYEYLKANKNAHIPCTVEVNITTKEQATLDGEEYEEDDEDQSLDNASTVEYLVRTALIRNKTIDAIMDDILENVFLPPKYRKYGKDIWGELRRGIGEGYDDLHLHYSSDKIDFASGIAHQVLDELFNTVEVLNDISQMQKHLGQVTEADMFAFKLAGIELIEAAAPIASLLALGELDLENIFKQEPDFETFVDDVISQAEDETNRFLPTACIFVDKVIEEAWRAIPKLDLNDLNPDLRQSVLHMANDILSEINGNKRDILFRIGGTFPSANDVMSNEIDFGWKERDDPEQGVFGSSGYRRREKSRSSHPESKPTDRRRSQFRLEGVENDECDPDQDDCGLNRKMSRRKSRRQSKKSGDSTQSNGELRSLRSIDMGRKSLKGKKASRKSIVGPAKPDDAAEMSTPKSEQPDKQDGEVPSTDAASHEEANGQVGVDEARPIVNDARPQNGVEPVDDAKQISPQVPESNEDGQPGKNKKSFPKDPKARGSMRKRRTINPTGDGEEEAEEDAQNITVGTVEAPELQRKIFTKDYQDRMKYKYKQLPAVAVQLSPVHTPPKPGLVPRSPLTVKPPLSSDGTPPVSADGGPPTTPIQQAYRAENDDFFDEGANPLVNLIVKPTTLRERIGRAPQKVVVADETKEKDYKDVPHNPNLPVTPPESQFVPKQSQHHGNLSQPQQGPSINSKNEQPRTAIGPDSRTVKSKMIVGFESREKVAQHPKQHKGYRDTGPDAIQDEDTPVDWTLSASEPMYQYGSGTESSVPFNTNKVRHTTPATAAYKDDDEESAGHAVRNRHPQQQGQKVSNQKKRVSTDERKRKSFKNDNRNSIDKKRTSKDQKHKRRHSYEHKKRSTKDSHEHKRRTSREPNYPETYDRRLERSRILYSPDSKSQLSTGQSQISDEPPLKTAFPSRMATRGPSTKPSHTATAMKIWDQMKQQYTLSKQPKQITPIPVVEEMEKEEELEEVVEKPPPPAKHPVLRRKPLSGPEHALKIDPEKIKRMKELRESKVDDWAHQKMSHDDEEEDPARLIRLTADKVVMEICTMALAHLLLEAEAGRSTAKILDAMKRLRKDDKSAKTEWDIMLWNSSLQELKDGDKRKKPTHKTPRSVGQDVGPINSLKQQAKEMFARKVKTAMLRDAETKPGDDAK